MVYWKVFVSGIYISITLFFSDWLSFMSFKDWAEVVSGFITAFSAFGAVIIAYVGLDKGFGTWRKQRKSNAEHQAARKLYKAVLKLRSAISVVRNPFIWPGEEDKAIEQLKRENPKLEIQGHKAVYKIRWEKIIEAFATLELEALEAEVFWGEDVKKLIFPLRRLVGRLNAAVSQLLNPEMRGSSSNYCNIVYEKLGEDNKDEFTREIDSAVKEVANFLRPKVTFE